MSDKIEEGRAATESLIHYGVKGMKWGVRRKRTATRVTVSERPGKSLKTSGGQNRSSSKDARTAAVTGQLAKKSGYQALSNAQLRAYTERLNLEANAKRLDYNRKNPAVRFVYRILGKSGSTTAQQVSDQAASKLVKTALGTAVKIAV